MRECMRVCVCVCVCEGEGGGRGGVGNAAESVCVCSIGLKMCLLSDDECKRVQVRAYESVQVCM